MRKTFIVSGYWEKVGDNTLHPFLTKEIQINREGDADFLILTPLDAGTLKTIKAALNTIMLMEELKSFTSVEYKGNQVYLSINPGRLIPALQLLINNNLIDYETGNNVRSSNHNMGSLFSYLQRCCHPFSKKDYKPVATEDVSNTSQQLRRKYLPSGKIAS